MQTRLSNDALVDTIDNHIDKFELLDNQNILKINVEGVEWDILDNISPETLAKFGQIVLGPHDLVMIHDVVWAARMKRFLI